MKETIVTIEKNKRYQTIESFGVSSAWYGKEVGTWKNKEDIIKLLFDKKEGIGLTNIRYNLGAGSINDLYIKDKSRQTESFEVRKGVYDFTRDEHTLSLVDLALEYGA